MFSKMLRRLNGAEQTEQSRKRRSSERRPLLEKQLVPGATSEEDRSGEEDGAEGGGRSVP